VDSVGIERNFSSGAPQLSGDGSVALFHSFSAFVPDKTTTNKDFFVKDLTTGQIERINNTVSGGQPSTSAQLASISSNGRFVAFSSFSSDHTPNDNNFVPDVFIYDRVTKTTRLVSTDGRGLPVTDAGSGLHTLEISGDGRFVLFDSDSNQLVKGDKSVGVTSLFLKDTVTGGIALVDATPTGLQPASATLVGRLCNTSPLRVIFQTTDESLVPSASNGVADFLMVDVIAPQPPPFEKGTVISAPPAVEVSAKTATLTLASFKGVSLGKGKKSALLNLPQSAELAAILTRASKPRINYVVTITSGKGPKRDVRSKNSTRNTVTFRNLPPGNYTAKYTVQATQGKKVLFKTKPSPAANFAIAN